MYERNNHVFNVDRSILSILWKAKTVVCVSEQEYYHLIAAHHTNIAERADLQTVYCFFFRYLFFVSGVPKYEET